MVDASRHTRSDDGQALVQEYSMTHDHFHIHFVAVRRVRRFRVQIGLIDVQANIPFTAPEFIL